MTIEAAEVPRWAPRILISDRVSPGGQVDALLYRAPARFTAPAITFSAPQPLYVAGDSFTIAAERSGIVPGSTYLAGDYHWAGLFDPARTIVRTSDMPTIVAGNAAWSNYWHWLFQCLAPLLLAREVGLAAADALVPATSPSMRDMLRLADVPLDRLIELEAGTAAVPRHGVYSNLTSGPFAFTPHPRHVALYERVARQAPRSDLAGKRIFVTRRGSPLRVMENEVALQDALSARGFAIVAPETLSAAEQVALFRDAAMIVAQHGAALTNLLFAAPADEGPIVVELHQDNYLNQCFLKLCQVKRLRYTAVVNAMTQPGSDGRHHSRWTADIDLILRAADTC